MQASKTKLLLHQNQLQLMSFALITSERADTLSRFLLNFLRRIDARSKLEGQGLTKVRVGTLTTSIIGPYNALSFTRIFKPYKYFLKLLLCGE